MCGAADAGEFLVRVLGDSFFGDRDFLVLAGLLCEGGELLRPGFVIFWFCLDAIVDFWGLLAVSLLASCYLIAVGI